MKLATIHRVRKKEATVFSAI